MKQTAAGSVGWLCRRAMAVDGARASFCGTRLSTSAIKTPIYADYLSERSRARQPSAIRALQPLLAEPGMISLGGGMPNPETFPFDEISVGIRGGGDLAEGADSGNGTFTLRDAALESVLQYSSTRGLPSLVAHLEALQRREHGSVQPEPFQICVTTGSQDALTKAFDLFTGRGKEMRR